MKDGKQLGTEQEGGRREKNNGERKTTNKGEGEKEGRWRIKVINDNKIERDLPEPLIAQFLQHEVSDKDLSPHTTQSRWRDRVNLITPHNCVDTIQHTMSLTTQTSTEISIFVMIARVRIGAGHA